ncbi:hypothetical protein M758_9G058600 [Ceratodon purpureus]|nr:hypothetical protein M758_9G058600 [Ceratodon purpureus]
METENSMETEVDGSMPDDLQVALLLQEKLYMLSEGSVSGYEVAKLWSILEVAAQELEFFAEKHPKSYKRRRTSKDSIVCTHACSSHMELLNPALWTSLPHQMLQLIFARLSLRDIRSLRLLSKDWNTMVTIDSGFHRICDEAQGSSFALISEESCELGEFWTAVFNVKFNKWDKFKMAIKRPALASRGKSAAASTWTSPVMNTSVVCGDGGLLCFVSSVYLKSKLKRSRPTLFFTVVNPLTGISHELPPLLELCELRMVQIMTTSELNSFKVFVLGDYKTSKDDGGDSDPHDYDERGGTAQVYDSKTASWGRAEGSLGLVFGRRSSLAGGFLESLVFTMDVPCAYDFAGGRLINLNVIENSLEEWGNSETDISCAHYKDRIFVLRLNADGPANDALATQSTMYYIDEFYVQMPARTWVKVFTHRCAPFEHPPKSPTIALSLHACRGFLLVLAQTDIEYKASMRYNINLGWLYDLSSRKWRDLELPEGICSVDLMCDLKWSA